MKRFSSVLASIVLAAVLSVGAYVPLVAPAEAAVSNWQQGFSIMSRFSEDFASETFKQSVRNLKDNGIDYVTLIVPYYQSNTGSTDIAPGWNTPSDQTLIAGINYAHSLGMKVMLKPHLEAHGSDWRALINPADRDTWFRNYGAMLNHIADIGAQTGVEQICVGTELISMATYTSNENNTARWKALIADVRSRFGGTLTYSANWGGPGFPNEKDHIGFWSDLDYIGISAYFELYGGNDVATMKSEWDRYNRTQIKPLADTHGKPVLFTEIGYRSLNGAHSSPWDPVRGGSYDAQEQVNAYQALFEYWNTQGFMHGVHLWDWSSDPGAGGEGNINYTPQNKPAQNTMKQWFGGTGGSGTGTSTPPPPTDPQTSGTWNATAEAENGGVGQEQTININVTNTGNISNALVDVEIYNGSNRVFQQTFDGQTIKNGQPGSYTVKWTPTQQGQYTLKLGVFNSTWSTNYYWNDALKTLTIGQTTVDNGGTQQPGGTFAATASVSPAQPAVNETASIEAKITSKNTLNDALVDIEVYDASNNKTFQQFFTGQNFAAGETKTYQQLQWKPTVAGTYTIKAGIFSNNWTTNYYWNDSVTTVAVSQSGGGTTNPPTGTTTPPGNTGGNGGTSNPPQTSYATNIWWPTDGAAVGGVTPFKAMLEGLDVSQYSMYWQVDSGALNEMANSTVDYPHKESLVDVSGWSWKGNGPYVINFVSKNPSGTVISEKSVNITVAR